MAKERMAGEKLDEPTKASADAKQALSTSERNKQIREEIGNDPERLAERIGVVDRDKYDVSGFSDKEINMALQGGKFDDNDYARLTGKSVGGDSPTDGGTTPEDPKPVAPVQPPAVGEQDQWMDIPGGAPGADGASQNVQQDNDINTSITGDGNTVNNNQDNSVGQFLGGYMRKHNFFK